MSSSNYTKISQLDKITIDDLKSHDGIFELPIITTNGETVNLIEQEIGKTVISSGLGNNQIIDIYFKPNENITFLLDDLGIEYIGDKPTVNCYVAVTINDSPSEIYKLTFSEIRSKTYMISCDWNLENSQYKKIVNKVSICFFCIETPGNIDTTFFHINILRPSDLFLQNTDLMILNLDNIPSLYINKSASFDTNIIIPQRLQYNIGHYTPVGNLPGSYSADIIMLTNSFNSSTYLEGIGTYTVIKADRTTKINNGKFINSKMSPRELDSIFENYEILESDFIAPTNE